MHSWRIFSVYGSLVGLGLLMAQTLVARTANAFPVDAEMRQALAAVRYAVVPADEFPPPPACPDADNDGLCDSEEILYGTDLHNRDTDGDGLIDGAEVKIYGTDPRNPDTDADALIDGDEVEGVQVPGATKKYTSSPLSPDTDGDGLSDGEEVRTQGSDPRSADTDNDGARDGDEVHTYFTRPDHADTDADGLGDGIELTQAHSDPLNPDTDGDSLVDGQDGCPTLFARTDNGCPPGSSPITYTRNIIPSISGSSGEQARFSQHLLPGQQRRLRLLPS